MGKIHDHYIECKLSRVIHMNQIQFKMEYEVSVFVSRQTQYTQVIKPLTLEKDEYILHSWLEAYFTATYRTLKQSSSTLLHH